MSKNISLAGTVCLQCKSCVLHTWALQRWASYDGALYKRKSLFTIVMVANLCTFYRYVHGVRSVLCGIRLCYFPHTGRHTVTCGTDYCYFLTNYVKLQFNYYAMYVKTLHRMKWICYRHTATINMQLLLAKNWLSYLISIYACCLYIYKVWLICHYLVNKVVCVTVSFFSQFHRHHRHRRFG